MDAKAGAIVGDGERAFQKGRLRVEMTTVDDVLIKGEKRPFESAITTPNAVATVTGDM